jgi:lactate racemase
MLHWARELVVDRSVLVYAPPLFDRLGPWLGPVQLFADQTQLWNAVELALHRSGRNVTQPLVRVFPYGGLSYVTAYTDSAK